YKKSRSSFAPWKSCCCAIPGPSMCGGCLPSRFLADSQSPACPSDCRSPDHTTQKYPCSNSRIPMSREPKAGCQHAGLATDLRSSVRVKELARHMTGTHLKDHSSINMDRCQSKAL